MRLAILEFVIVGVLGACASPSGSESGPAGKKISMPTDPSRDGRAREETGKPVQILAERIELYLPPGLYAEVECAPQSHIKDEFDTGFGRRISMTPPTERNPSMKPARVRIGKWDLAGRGRVDILFPKADEGPAARARAFGVDLLVRDNETRRGLPEVDVDGNVVTTPGVR
jgi:hypothetical protein